MNSKKLFGILTGTMVLLCICLLVSVYAANNMLSGKSKELVDLRAAKMASEQKEKQLAKDKKDIQAYGELNEIAKTVVPQDKDQAKTVSEIVNLASQSG